MKLPFVNSKSMILVIVLNIIPVNCASPNILNDTFCERLRTSTCECTEFKYDFKIGLKCRQSNSEIVMSIRSGYVGFKCSENSTPEIYTLLPEENRLKQTLKSFSIQSVRFDKCPLIGGMALKYILKDKVNVDQVHQLIVSYPHDILVRREHLSGMNSLRDIRFFNQSSEFQEDALEDVSYITTLVFQSVNVDLPPTIFKYLYDLQRLDIIENNSTHLSPGIFKNLGKMKRLILKNNEINDFSTDSFIGALSIIDLYIYHNDIEQLPPNVFDALKSIETINMRDNHFINNTLPAGLLAQKPNLRRVILNQNNFENLTADIFEESPNIQTIDLQSNLLTTLPDIIFSSQIELKTVNLSRNRLIELPNNLFKNSNRLEVIDLSHNNLTTIPNSLFSGLKNLYKVDLSHNQLLEFDADAFVIQELHRNKYTTAKWDVRLDLSYNHISAVDIFQFIRFFFDYSYRVDLSNNQITKITGEEVIYSTFIEHAFPKPYNKWTWIFDKNPIICDCGIMYFLKLIHSTNPTVRKNLNIELGNLRCAGPSPLNNSLVSDLELGDLVCPFDFHFGNLSEVSCPMNCICWWRAADETGIFDCSNAGLTEVPVLPSYKDGIRWLKFELNLENNWIKNLPKTKQTTGYEQVVKINMRNNSLQNISDENVPPNVTAIDISMNQLKTIDVKLLERFNEKDLYFKLAGNPFVCECDTDFMKYLRWYKTKVDYQNITCEDGDLIQFKSSTCSPYRSNVIFACAAVGFLGLMIGCVIALYYKYQQVIKIFLFAHNLCLWFITEDEMDKDKKYDAFISFSHKDEDFVMQELVPELEKDPHSYKICLHMRDWVPGEFISDQIIKTVDESRRTIIVFSPNFIESVWGRMEFQVAHQKAMKEGCTRLIVVIYGDVGNIEELDPDLKAYLDTKTYVRWGDPWFFNKLRYALPHKSVSESNGVRKLSMMDSADNGLELR